MRSSRPRGSNRRVKWRQVAAAGVLAVLIPAGLAACGEAAPQVPVPGPVGGGQNPSPSPSPSPSPTPSETTPPASNATTCGSHAETVELAMQKVGIPKGTDCDGIKAFQERFDIRPFDGIAGESTKNVAQRLLNTNTADCGASRYGTVACVDLTNQTTWVMRDGKLLLGPTVTRTGMKDFATPTGTYTVDWKTLKDWSKPYKVWLPYWMSFNNDIGFHETTSYLHNAANGSHGCVNLLRQDAVAFYDALDEGDTVKVFGHRPGT